VREEVAPIGHAVVRIGNTSLMGRSFWTPSKLSSNVNTAKKLREKLINKSGLKLEPHMSRCMITGIEGDGQLVVCAHIVPKKVTQADLILLGLRLNFVNSVRNGLLLIKSLEVAFDKCQLSFERVLYTDGDGSIRSGLRLKIWDDAIRLQKLFPESTQTIGTYEGAFLTLGEVSPCLRALSYHNYQCWLQLSGELPQTPEDYSSNSNNGFSRMIHLKQAEVMKAEVDEDEEEDETEEEEEEEEEEE